MITLSYEGSFTMSDVQKVASSALENNGLTLQTGRECCYRWPDPENLDARYRNSDYRAGG